MIHKMNGDAEAIPTNGVTGLLGGRPMHTSDKLNGKTAVRDWRWNRLRDFLVGQRGLEIIGMSTSPQPDKNGQIVLNPAKLLFYLAVLGAVAGAWVWSLDRAEKNAEERGHQRAEIEFLQRQIHDAQTTAQQAKDTQLMNSSGGQEPSKEKH